MNANNINIIIDKEGICNLVFDSKNQEHNLFNGEVINELSEIIDSVINDTNIIGFIISSAKKSFHHGYDLKYLYTLNNAGEIFDQIYKLSKTLRKLEISGKPVVCAISGSSNLGGLELILHCHYKIADNSNSTNISINNIKYDLCPNIGGSQRLPRSIGVSDTLDLLLNDNTLSTKDAYDKKIIDEITNKEQLFERCKIFIKNNKESYQIWDKKQNISPFEEKHLGYFISKIAMLHAENADLYPSVKILMSSIFEGLNTDVNTGLKIEARHFTWLLNHKETRSMLKTLKFTKSRKKVDENIIKLCKKSLEENYSAEGVKLLIEGVAAPLIENAGKRLGFIDSPLASADKLELQSLIPHLDSTDAAVSALIRSMQKINRKGCSTNKGFYDYKDNKKLKLWHGLKDLIPPSNKQPEISFVEKRLLFSCINNMLYNYTNIFKNNDQNLFDYLSITKMSLPTWTGGPFSWIKNFNVKKFNIANKEFEKSQGSRFIVDQKLLDSI